MPRGIKLGSAFRRRFKSLRKWFCGHHRRPKNNPPDEDVQDPPSLQGTSPCSEDDSPDSMMNEEITNIQTEEQLQSLTSQPLQTQNSVHCTQKTMLQYESEEVEEGAVYSVLLRRVQIQQAEGARGLKVEEDQFSPEHTANQYKTCKIRTIKAGTLEKLVENLLTAFEDNDFTYITIFLSTYRAFASTKEVLELLLDRYGNSKTLSCEKLKPHNFSKPNREVRIAIGSISKAWLDECPEDFREPPDYPCLLKLLDYLQRNIPNSEPERRAQNLLELFLSQEVETCCEFHDSFLCNLSEEELLISCPEDLEFFLFPEDLVAEQLTYMDAELFKRVVPHHCLGCIWSQRHKEENKHLVATINATISQFNAVSRCVTNTILKNKALKAQERAKTIEKWICIASECRSLKNFSSLKAIISALQSNSICKLKKAWAYVKKDTKLMFNELSGIFPSHDNYLTPRNLLFQTRLQAPGSAQEGTSKSEDLDCSLIGYHRRTQRQLHFQTDRRDVQGTVPYLGTFLTDLIMLDTALQDYVEGSLINFEKMRREFEVIDQIKLLQSACNSYCMTPDTTFIQWFTEQQHLTEEERPFPSTDVLAQSTPIIWQHKFAPAGSSVESMDLTSDSTSEDDHIIFKGSSEESLKKKHSSSSSMDESPLSSTTKKCSVPISNTKRISVPIATNKHSVSSSMDESSVSTAIDNCSLSSSNNESSVSLTSITSKVLPPLYNQQKEDLCIIQTKLTSQDKTDSVIQRGILKHNLESDTAEDYELLQIIPEAKELVLSASAKMLNGHVNFDSILWKTALGSRQVQMTGHCRPKLPRAARWDHWASNIPLQEGDKATGMESWLGTVPLLPSSITQLQQMKVKILEAETRREHLLDLQTESSIPFSLIWTLRHTFTGQYGLFFLVFLFVYFCFAH